MIAPAGGHIHPVYPVNLNITGRLCVVIGGGPVAERKIGGILASNGRVRLVSPEAVSSLQVLASQRTIEWRRKPYGPDDLAGAFLVFAATGNLEVQASIVRDTCAAGLLVNVADDPAACDFHLPATVRRGDLTLTVSTRGRSPAVSAMVRRRLEGEFGEEYGRLTALMACLRDQLLAAGGRQATRRDLFRDLLHEDMIDWLRAGRDDRIREHLVQTLGRSVDPALDALIKETP